MACAREKCNSCSSRARISSASEAIAAHAPRSASAPPAEAPEGASRAHRAQPVTTGHVDAGTWVEGGSALLAGVVAGAVAAPPFYLVLAMLRDYLQLVQTHGFSMCPSVMVAMQVIGRIDRI